MTQVRSFLGLANYFRKFVQGYSKIALPLSRLTQKSRHFEWSSECQTAFEQLKYYLTHAPLLKMPELGKEFEVVTDASDYALGAVLIQDGRPVAYESRKLIPAEINYSATEKEMLASIHALKVWRCYLE